MVLNYCATNYIGWPLPAFFNMVQSYENYLNYPNISAIILLKINDLSVK